MLPCVGAEADSWKRAIDQAMHGRSITSNGGKELIIILAIARNCSLKGVQSVVDP